MDPGLRQITACRKQAFICDYNGGWVQCQARDTYLCTNCYVWDDAVERKVDISAVWALCQSNSERRGGEPPIESQLESWPSLSSETLLPHTLKGHLGQYSAPEHPTMPGPVM